MVSMDNMSLTHLDAGKKQLSAEDEKLQRYNQMINREMNSGIMLEAIFFIQVPIKGAFKLDYKMNYSIFESEWTEEKLRNKQHKSRPCQFKYLF